MRGRFHCGEPADRSLSHCWVRQGTGVADACEGRDSYDDCGAA